MNIQAEPCCCNFKSLPRVAAEISDCVAVELISCFNGSFSSDAFHEVLVLHVRVLL